MLHHSGKNKSGHERNTQRIGHRLVVLLEGILVDVESQLLIEVLEEDASHIVTLTDDDGVLLRELLQIGKRRAKHRVGRHIAHACLLVEILQVGLHRGNIADDTLLGQVGYHLLEHRNSVFQRDGIDQQFRLELLNFLIRREALTIVGKAHALGITLKDSHLVVEAQQVDEETSHLSCAHD